MKFSVVIPCHDRLELLKEAVYTVLQQGWKDWELVIFDNASKGGLYDYLKGLSDPRVHYDRSDEFLPVTESWNRAIGMATGEYVIFLGDDDGLTPDYFSRIATIIEQFGKPEILYSAFYQFMHPEVAPWAPGGYVIDIKNGYFFARQDKPFLLPLQQALKAVKGSVSFRRNFTFNIQAFVFSRTFLSRLKQEGPIFQSPFPDYYMANIVMVKSKSTVVIPDPMTIAGVSKASVGYALFNGLEDRFAEILNMQLTSDPLFKNIERFLLPGPLYNSNYLITMEYVVKNACPPLEQKVNYRRYRRLQIYARLCSDHTQGKKHLNLPYWGQLSPIEKAESVKLFLLLKLGKKNKYLSRVLFDYLKLQPDAHAFNAIIRTCNENGYQHLINVFDDLKTGALA